MRKKSIEELVGNVASTMALEGMALHETEKENLRKILRGEIRYEDHIADIVARAKEKGKKYGSAV